MDTIAVLQNLGTAMAVWKKKKVLIQLHLRKSCFPHCRTFGANATINLLRFTDMTVLCVQILEVKLEASQIKN